ncbi:MAG: decaprenyl-phosphate phosphoribosyltransferase [bacterium]
MIKYIVSSARLKQWLKNIFIFAGIVFSKHFFEPDALLKIFTAFILFSLASSGVYIMNDIFDRTADSFHPKKKFRPIASGKLPLKIAIITLILLFIASLIPSYFLYKKFFVLLLSYVLLQFVYSIYLKKLVIVDILVVSLGFVLRVVGGCIVIDVQISSWLILCSALLSLFIVLNKRRQEILLLDENNTRKVLKEYSLPFLDQMINVISAATITSYLLYAFSSESSCKFGGHKLGYSVPFVLYGIFRYLYITQNKSLGEEPEKIVLTDFPFIINFLIWAITIFIVVYT